MRGEDFEEFLRLMFDVAELYDKQKPTAGAMKHYFAALSQLTLEEVRGALSYHVKASKFFPRPSEILAHVQGSAEDRARAAWRRVVGAMIRVGTWSSVHFDDPVTHYAIEQMGGWEALGGMESKDMPFREKDFIHWYGCGERGGMGWDAVPWALLGRNALQNMSGGHELPTVRDAETGRELSRDEMLERHQRDTGSHQNDTRRAAVGAMVGNLSTQKALSAS